MMTRVLGAGREKTYKIFLHGIFTSRPKQSHPLFIATPSSPTEKTEFISVALIELSGSNPSVFGASLGLFIVTYRATMFDEYFACNARKQNVVRLGTYEKRKEPYK